MVEERFGIKMNFTRLRLFYLSNGVKLRTAKTVYRTAIENASKLHPLRLEFARLIANFKADNYPVIYVDETTFSTWETQKRSWSHKDHVNVHVRNNAQFRCTVYGAIGACMESPTMIIGSKTEQV
jgi:hypothetical protein